MAGILSAEPKDKRAKAGNRAQYRVFVASARYVNIGEEKANKLMRYKLGEKKKDKGEKMTFYDMGQLIAADRAAKPGGTTYDADAVKLQELYEDRAQRSIRSFLMTLGIGDKDNPYPLDVAALKMIVESQSVVYSTPPVRALTINGG